MPRILVDADACPVKDEIYKVAFRHGTPVSVVANAYMRLPDHPLLERVVVADAFDAADDWIAERADAQSIVVTSDILLADRCLKAGATVISSKGEPFTADMIGSAIAARAIMTDLRASIGTKSGEQFSRGPAPFRKEDRSRFLQALDREVIRLQK